MDIPQSASESSASKHVLFKGQGQLMILVMVVGGGFILHVVAFECLGFVFFSRGSASGSPVFLISLSLSHVLSLLMFIYSPSALLLLCCFWKITSGTRGNRNKMCLKLKKCTSAWKMEKHGTYMINHQRWLPLFFFSWMQNLKPCIKQCVITAWENPLT